MKARLDAAVKGLAEWNRRLADARTAADQIAMNGYQTDDERSRIVRVVFEAEEKRELAIKEVLLAFADEPPVGSER